VVFEKYEFGVYLKKTKGRLHFSQEFLFEQSVLGLSRKGAIFSFF